MSRPAWPLRLLPPTGLPVFFLCQVIAKPEAASRLSSSWKMPLALYVAASSLPASALGPLCVCGSPPLGTPEHGPWGPHGDSSAPLVVTPSVCGLEQSPPHLRVSAGTWLQPLTAPTTPPLTPLVSHPLQARTRCSNVRIAPWERQSRMHEVKSYLNASSPDVEVPRVEFSPRA